MTATLRVVLDQIFAPPVGDIGAATRDLTRELIRLAPRGCEVAGIAPAGDEDYDSLLPGISGVHRAALGRRELAAAWQLGIARSAGGMIHSPSLMAPLVRHDRANDNAQTVITVWDLAAWEAPDDLPRPVVTWQRSMLRRAVKHADAVVVPTHAMAERIGEIARLGDRVRVIPGAVDTRFRAPKKTDAVERELGLPETYVVVAGTTGASDGVADALRGIASADDIDIDVVVIGAAEGEEPAIVELAVAAGLPERRVHVRGDLDPRTRAVLLARAALFVEAGTRSRWPWRLVEALAAGVPVVATDGDVHREVLWDGGLIAERDALGEAVATALGSEGDRLRLLGADRVRAFSWGSAAERVWQLHADL